MEPTHSEEEDVAPLVRVVTSTPQPHPHPECGISNCCGYGFRWVFSILCSFGFVIVYALRVCLSVAVVLMDEDFKWDPYKGGLILSSFFVGYLVLQIPAGNFAEKRGGQGIYGWGVFLTSFFTALTPIAAKTGFHWLLACRILTGLAEGVTYPAMHAMISRWAPPDERTKMSGVIYAGSSLGTVLALPISAFIAFSFGWEMIFYFFSLTGIFWCLLWAFFASDCPHTNYWMSQEEKNYIELSLIDDVQDTRPPIPFRAIMRSGPFWAIFMAHVCNSFGFYTMLLEMPDYMEKVLHFNIKENGLLSAIPYGIAFIVSMSVSFIADHMIVKNWLSLTSTRKFFNTIGFMAPCIALMVLAFSEQSTNKTLTVALLCISVGLGGATNAGFGINHIDIAPNFAGTLMGFTNMAANSVGIIAPALAGAILKCTDDSKHWKTVFIICSVVFFIGNTFYIFLASGEEQEFNQITADEPLIDNDVEQQGNEEIVEEEEGPDMS